MKILINNSSTHYTIGEILIILKRDFPDDDVKHINSDGYNQETFSIIRKSTSGDYEEHAIAEFSALSHDFNLWDIRII